MCPRHAGTLTQRLGGWLGGWAGLAILAAAPLAPSWAQQRAPAPAASAAPAFVPHWQWSGYATLGYTDIHADNARSFARDQTQDQPGRVALDSRLGLQVNGQLAPTVGLTAQIVARQLAADTPALQSLEWAFLSWTPAPEWQIRVGRTSPDIFLFADVRSVGVAYPWVRPNQEFYGWMPIQSVDGIDATRSWATPEAMWRLKVAYGQARATLVAQSSGTTAPARVQAMRTLTLSRETLDWTVKFSYFRGVLDLRRGQALAALNSGLAQVQALPVPLVAQQAAALRDAVPLLSPSEYFAIGGQYDGGRWLMTSELSAARGRAQQARARRGYLSVGRRIDDLTLFAIASASVMPNPALTNPDQWLRQLTPVIGPNLAAQASALGYGAARAANLARISQRAWGLGLRWDLRPRVALKVQAERVTADADGTALWQTTAPGDVRATVLSLAVDASF